MIVAKGSVGLAEASKCLARVLEGWMGSKSLAIVSGRLAWAPKRLAWAIRWLFGVSGRQFGASGRLAAVSGRLRETDWGLWEACCSLQEASCGLWVAGLRWLGLQGLSRAAKTARRLARVEGHFYGWTDRWASKVKVGQTDPQTE